MSPNDKLALAMSLFVIFFVGAFLVVPASAYHEYFADLRRRKRGALIKALLGCAYVLALPYFYDQLIGFNSRVLSVLLNASIGACAYTLLIDVAWFAYRHFGPPSQRPRRAK